MKHKGGKKKKSLKQDKKQIKEKDIDLNEYSSDELSSPSQEVEKPPKKKKKAQKKKVKKKKSSKKEDENIPSIKMTKISHLRFNQDELYETRTGGERKKRKISEIFYAKISKKILVDFGNTFFIFKGVSPYDRENEINFRLPDKFDMAEDSFGKIWICDYDQVKIFSLVPWQLETTINLRLKPKKEEDEYNIKEIIQIKGRKMLLNEGRNIMLMDDNYQRIMNIKDNDKLIQKMISLEEEAFVAITGTFNVKLMKYNLKEKKWLRPKTIEIEPDCDIITDKLYKGRNALYWMGGTTSDHKLWIKKISLDSFDLISTVYVDVNESPNSNFYCADFYFDYFWFLRNEQIYSFSEDIKENKQKDCPITKVIDLINLEGNLVLMKDSELNFMIVKVKEQK